MAKEIADVNASISEDDLKQINEELEVESGKKPDTESSTVEKTVEDVSQKESSKEPSETVSEDVKTPPTETKPVKVRERKTSQSVPYERFKEVNDKLQKALKDSSQNRPLSTPDPNQELEGFEQTVPSQDDLQTSVKNTAVKAVQDILEPVLTTIDKQMEDQEYQKTLDNHPEAQQYESEIKDYANKTNLTYEDIATLVLAKHQKQASASEVKQAEEETQETELGGKSNSTAKRKTSSSVDIKNLPTDELEKLVDSIK